MVWGLDNARAIIGAVLIIVFCWAISENRKAFPLRLAIGAIGVQAALVLLLFGIPQAQLVLNAINGLVDGLAIATNEGTKFIFGYLGGGDMPYLPKAPDAPPPFLFAFQVLPLILVISALSAVLCHWKILQYITRGFGLLFEKSMGLVGASALATAANIFMRMVESPIVIKGYLDKLSRSELFMMMVVGLSTVAGSTMIAYCHDFVKCFTKCGGPCFSGLNYYCASGDFNRPHNYSRNHWLGRCGSRLYFFIKIYVINGCNIKRCSR